jgi:predicted NUDIX family phosphoesterase
MHSIIAHVPRACLPAALPSCGLLPDPDHALLATLRANLAWSTRGPLEQDPTQKQLIPYVVIRCGELIWAMRRTRAQSEARLHDRLSLGVGGHMEQIDVAEGQDVILRGLLRELHEEIVAPQDPTLTYLGLINDDTTEVGQVHIGLLYLAALPTTQGVAVRETDKHVGEWLDRAALEARRGLLETWSAIALDALGASEQRIKTP